MSTLAAIEEKLEALYSMMERIELKQNQINGDLHKTREELVKVKSRTGIYALVVPILVGILGVFLGKLL